MANVLNSLAYIRWKYKFHIVFAPKYRRMVFYGEKKQAIGTILRKLCEWKGVGNPPSRSVPGSYPYACKYPAQDISIRINGIPKREK